MVFGLNLYENCTIDTLKSIFWWKKVAKGDLVPPIMKIVLWMLKNLIFRYLHKKCSVTIRYEDRTIDASKPYFLVYV